jgi:hypothetical protein
MAASLRKTAALLDNSLRIGLQMPSRKGIATCLAVGLTGDTRVSQTWLPPRPRLLPLKV